MEDSVRSNEPEIRGATMILPLMRIFPPMTVEVVVEVRGEIFAGILMICLLGVGKIEVYQ